MSTLMMPAATMTTMTNTAPIAVTQPKVADPAKLGLITNNNNNKQGKTRPDKLRHVSRKCLFVHILERSKQARILRNRCALRFRLFSAEGQKL